MLRQHGLTLATIGGSTRQSIIDRTDVNIHYVDCPPREMSDNTFRTRPLGWSGFYPRPRTGKPGIGVEAAGRRLRRWAGRVPRRRFNACRLILLTEVTGGYCAAGLAFPLCIAFSLSRMGWNGPYLC
jgi:hypothetical protein